MTAPTVVAATQERFGLGEGPVWDVARRRLLWVDILAGAVMEGSVDGDLIEVTGRTEIGGMVGAVAPADDGGLIVAAQERLVRVRPDSTRVAGPFVVPPGTGRRLNDGAVDPGGCFLVGTLSLAEATGTETLVRIEGDGTLTQLDDDLTLSNGLAWSSDGRRLFSVDTLRGTVFVRTYDSATGTVGPRREWLHLDGELPDGIAMDAHDHLWIAVWGAGEVRRYAPDGTLVVRVPVPAPHTSCVAFAGEDLRTLVITTATDELSDEQRHVYPDSGRVFTAHVDVPGLPMPAWSSAAL